MSGEPPVREKDILRRCGLSEIATPSWTPAEDVAAYAARGFAAIGIWLHKLERGSIDGFWIPEATIAPEVVEATAASVRGADERSAGQRRRSRSFREKASRA